MGRDPRVSSKILQRVANGDPEAVDQCLAEFGGLVWSLARRLAPNHTEAEDCVQEIFIDLWKHAGRYQPEIASEATFIATIARRRLIDRQRKRSRSPDTADIADQPVAAPPEKNYAEINEEAACAADCLNELREEEREVLRLSIYDGLSQSKISEKTGLPLGTVKTHCRRGLIKLRELMQDRRPGLVKGGAG